MRAHQSKSQTGREGNWKWLYNFTKCKDLLIMEVTQYKNNSFQTTSLFQGLLFIVIFFSLNLVGNGAQSIPDTVAHKPVEERLGMKESDPRHV